MAGEEVIATLVGCVMALCIICGFVFFLEIWTKDERKKAVQRIQRQERERLAKKYDEDRKHQLDEEFKRLGYNDP